MIDSTKSPMPAWKRYGIVVLLAVLIASAGYVVWAKELRHKSSGSAAPPAATAPAAAAPAHPAQTPSKKAATTTTIPGGIPLSSRNPFGS